MRRCWKVFDPTKKHFPRQSSYVWSIGQVLGSGWEQKVFSTPLFILTFIFVCMHQIWFLLFINSCQKYETDIKIYFIYLFFSPLMTFLFLTWRWLHLKDNLRHFLPFEFDIKPASTFESAFILHSWQQDISNCIIYITMYICVIYIHWLSILGMLVNDSV